MLAAAKVLQLEILTFVGPCCSAARAEFAIIVIKAEAIAIRNDISDLFLISFSRRPILSLHYSGKLISDSRLRYAI
jgi:hypothetical protein